MAESARHLVEDVFGLRPVRQWVLSFPYPLRFLFADKPEAIGPVPGIVQCLIGGWLADPAGVPRDTAQCGAVTPIRRFGSAFNLNIHFHMLWLDGVYEDTTEPPQRKPRLHRTRAPTSTQLTQLAAAIAHRVCRHLTPWRNGTTHVEWDAVDFIAKLAALVPPPRAHLTRFHGVLAPNANLRAQLTPAGQAACDRWRSG